MGSINFKKVAIGQSSTVATTVRNVDKEPVTLLALGTTEPNRTGDSGSHFVAIIMQGDCLSGGGTQTLAAKGGSCTIHVKFTPKQSKPKYMGTLEVFSNTIKNVGTGKLTGSGK